jgi:cytochrome b561
MLDTVKKFSKITIYLHWIIAVAMIGLVAVGLYMEDLPDGPDKFQLFGLHKSFGILVLSLASLRLLWRFRNGMPKSVADNGPFLKLVTKVVHWFLLLATILMPISGIIMSLSGGYGLSIFGFELVAKQVGDAGFVANELMGEIGSTIHGLGGDLILIALGLHVVGALKHHIFDKDDTLNRMIGKEAK